MTIDAIAKAYRWQPSEIFKFTDTQLSIISHAAWASYERGERRRKFENTCEFCASEGITDGRCNSCKRLQRNKPVKISKARNVIEWPPHSGIFYEDDENESAQQKFKKADRKGFMEYYFGGDQHL